jgi:hypothetical protein
MKANRNIYALDCNKLAGQVESLKAKLSKAKLDETVLDSGLTSNSKVICELLDLNLNDNVNKHPEAKLNIKINNEETELEIHKSNLKKILKM